MKKLNHMDAAEAAKLRDYADQLSAIGKEAAASIWREMADRIEASCRQADADRLRSKLKTVAGSRGS
jgi:ribosomal protein L18E